MGKNSKIEWCDHTFNGWIGCAKVSAGCENCYAEALMDKRLGRVKWGPNGTRSRTGKSYWDRTTVWGMLKNPAYKGTAAFGKTKAGPWTPPLRAQRGHAEQPKRAAHTSTVPAD